MKALNSLVLLVVLVLISSCGVVPYVSTQKTVAERTAAETALLAGCANGGKGEPGQETKSSYKNTDGETVEVKATSSFSPAQCERLWNRYFDVQERKAEQPVLIQQRPYGYSGYSSGYTPSYYSTGTYLGSFCLTGCNREIKTVTKSDAVQIHTPNVTASSSRTRTRTSYK